MGEHSSSGKQQPTGHRGAGRVLRGRGRWLHTGTTAMKAADLLTRPWARQAAPAQANSSPLVIYDIGAKRGQK